MEEIWEPVSMFEGLYEVSNFGRVKALERLVENHGGLQKKHERILKPSVTNNQHCRVVLCKNGKTYPKFVHRLVATAFIPNPDGKPVVDHIDANPLNNRVDNLRWATVQENCLNPLTRQRNSASKMGHPYYGRPLTDEEREKISASLRGKKLSENHRAVLSAAHRNSTKAMESSLKNLEKAHLARLKTAKKGEKGHASA